MSHVKIRLLQAELGFTHLINMQLRRDGNGGRQIFERLKMAPRANEGVSADISGNGWSLER